MEFLLRAAPEGRRADKSVAPNALQTSWIDLPPFFGGGSETGRDVAQEYIQSKLSSLPTHTFLKHTKGSTDYEALPVSLLKFHFRFSLELFVDN